jgi:hypothetical protein
VCVWGGGGPSHFVLLRCLEQTRKGVKLVGRRSEQRVKREPNLPCVRVTNIRLWSGAEHRPLSAESLDLVDELADRRVRPLGCLDRTRVQHLVPTARCVCVCVRV